MAWLFLLAAGCVEVAFALSIEPTRGFTRPLQTALCFVLGIGAVGAVTLGMLLFGDPVTLGRLIPIALIVVGIVALRLFSAV